MPKVVSPDQKDKIIELYKEGYTKLEIAKKLNISNKTVAKIIHEYEKELETLQKKAEISEEDRELLIALKELRNKSKKRVEPYKAMDNIIKNEIMDEALVNTADTIVLGRFVKKHIVPYAEELGMNIKDFLIESAEYYVKGKDYIVELEEKLRFYKKVLKKIVENYLRPLGLWNIKMSKIESILLRYMANDESPPKEIIEIYKELLIKGPLFYKNNKNEEAVKLSNENNDAFKPEDKYEEAVKKIINVIKNMDYNNRDVIQSQEHIRYMLIKNMFSKKEKTDSSEMLELIKICVMFRLLQMII